MATVTSAPYDIFMITVTMGQQDFSTDTLKIALIDGGYTPDTSNHVGYGSISGNEVTGSGYIAGGQALTGTNLGYVNGHIAYTASAITWTGLTATFRYAVIYNDTVNKYLIGYVDYGEDQVYANQDFTLSFGNGFLAMLKGTA